MDAFRRQLPPDEDDGQGFLGPADDPQPPLLGDPSLLQAANEAAGGAEAPPQPPTEAPAEDPAPVAPSAPALAPRLVASDLGPAALRKLITDAGVSELSEIQLITLLIKDGRLTPNSLPAFLAAAANSDITTYALTTRLAAEADLVAITAELYGMEPVVLSTTPIEEDIALLITPTQANAWNVLPYGRDELNSLMVAISNPEDQAARDNLQRALPREHILYRFALPAELTIALDRVYRDASSSAGVNASIAAVAREVRFEERIVVRDTDGSIIQLVDSIIQKAAKEDASDIHIEPREHHTDVRFRIDGILRVSMRPIPSGPITTRMVARIKTLADLKPDERRLPQDGRITITVGANKQMELRVVTVPTIYGEQVTMRLLDKDRAMLSLEALGMTPNNLVRYEAAIQQPHGCCIITGPTGSGKSTTLYSSAMRVVDSERKFISIEDPVEYRLPGITQIDVSRQGDRALDFAGALKAILRSDPDIIMVGEIRDQETAITAMEASLTGHFLYSTLHTRDALEAITRLGRLKIEPFLVAEAVAVLVAQRLVRCLCPACRVPYIATPDFLHGVGAPTWAQGQELQLYKASPEGCPACNELGYRGRTGVHEVVTMTEELKQLITVGTSQEELVRFVRSQDMHSLRDDAFIKVAGGITSMEELARVVL